MLVCLAFALLVQIATNLSNDHQDFVRGADTSERLGPRRAVAAGWVAPQVMARAAASVFAAAFLVGLLLVPLRGWELLPIGIVSVVAGYAYTGGPRPLAYHALGDLFVFVFFGLTAVCATCYVLLGSVPSAAWLAGASLGLLAVNILVVNNTRDRDTDEAAGKRTLAVRIGVQGARLQYWAQLVAAYALTLPLGFLSETRGVWVAWLTLPLASGVGFAFQAARTGPEFNRALGATALVLLAFGATLCLGLWFG